jgi:CRP-like cAMP-binding protein
MSTGSSAAPRVTTDRSDGLKAALAQVIRGSAEQQAIDAGEVDAVIDYSRGNVILFPAAQFALRERAQRMAAAKQSLAVNGILAALPGVEHQRLLAGLEPVKLQFGAILHELGARVTYVYFPVDGVACLMSPVEDRHTLAVGLVGREGFVGIAPLLEADVSSVRALVVVTGMALRMEAGYFSKAVQQCPALRRELLRFAHMKLLLARKTVGCSCFHSAEARFANWLLMISDRVSSPEFMLTQESLAGMLGLRRCTVTECAGDLQRCELISYARGHIKILDRSGLEQRACSCYSGIGNLG